MGFVLIGAVKGFVLTIACGHFRPREAVVENARLCSYFGSPERHGMVWRWNYESFVFSIRCGYCAPLMAVFENPRLCDHLGSNESHGMVWI